MPRPTSSRRDEGKYRQYVTEEQPSQVGCSAGRMQPVFRHGPLGLLCRPQLGDKGADRGGHPFGGLNELDPGLVDDLFLFHIGYLGVGDTPLDDDRGAAQLQPQVMERAELQRKGPPVAVEVAAGFLYQPD